ncbi:RagB/SusD family nutrient uptake outer membrane protein [Sphingobacteruim zhuxiongii]|nr:MULTISPECIES: RagB/SusD family nutrient uptake outer membrane protein [unclassified Sphingobacterium]
MKMKVKNLLTYSAVLLMSMASCTKTLELDPVSQISNQSFWKSEADVTGALNGMYVRLRGQAIGNLFAWGELRAETMDRSLAGAAGLQVFYFNELDRANVGTAAGNGMVNSTWQGMYTVIHDANLLLKFAPGITYSSDAVKNQVLAEAYTMRAYAYFVLTKTWGALPIVTDPTEGYKPEVIMKERSSKEEVMKLIKSDMEAALSLYPNSNFKTGRNMWSKPATYALKAEVNLWTGKTMGGGANDFQAALTSIAEIEKSDVALLDNYASIFDYENKGNKEVLMAVRFQDLEAGDNIFANIYMSGAYMTSAADQASKDKLGVLGGLPIMAMSQLARNQFTLDDQRRDATFIEVNIPKAGGGTEVFASAVSKFSGTVIGGNRRFIDDIILYRYADVLLMKAEAQNALNQDPTEAINKVRKRAYGANYSNHIYVHSSATLANDAILKERLLELAVEGKRWWDLIRFDKAFDLVPSLQAKKGKDYLKLFPIAETTLSLEPKIQQNEGYL